MAKNPKYPETKLTDEDKKQLDEVIVKIAGSYGSLRTKYPNSKAYAENVMLKWLDSKADCILWHMLELTRQEPLSNPDN